MKDILQDLAKEDKGSCVYRIQSEAITLLHSQAEQLAVEVLPLYNRAACQAKRDIAYIRALSEGFNSHLTFVLRQDLDRCLKSIQKRTSVWPRTV